MQSRLEKYKNDENTTSLERTSINKDLYSKVYDASFHTELTNIDGTNEIDISKVKQMVQNREDFLKQKKYYEFIKPISNEEVKEEPKENLVADDKIVEELDYDINSVLKKAKENRTNTNNVSYRTLPEVVSSDEESYEQVIPSANSKLKKLDKTSKVIEEELNNEKERLMNLINTISIQNSVKKQETIEMSLDLLSSLKDSEKTIAKKRDDINDEKSIAMQELNKEIKKPVYVDDDIDYEDSLEKKDEDDLMATSFYSKQFNFKKKDFVTTKEKKGVLSTVVIVFLVIMIVAIISFIVLILFDFIKF